jgi:aspartate aminotransferase-like enzyme/GNAT superfamily N-acetyltransferase
MAADLGVEVEVLPADWRAGVDYAALRDALGADASAPLKAVCAVHNETSTGMTLDLARIRATLDEAGHPALLLADTISSLGSIDFRMDEWGVDAAVGGSQKGLMLPVGFSFTAASEKALAAHGRSTLPKHYFPLEPHAGAAAPSFIGTVPVALFYGLREALRLIEEEGLENVLARHARLAEAVRRCVRHWSGNGEGKVELFCRAPERVSDSVTSILLPEGHDAEALRRRVARLNVALGAGLGRLGGKVFRIGHLGDLNEPMVLGTLAATRSASGWKACRTRRAGWMRRWAGWRRRPPDPPSPRPRRMPARSPRWSGAPMRPGCRSSAGAPAPMDDDFAAICAAGEAHLLEAEGRILGVIVLEDAPDHLWIDNVAVEPALKGGGLGRLLLAFAEAEARWRRLPSLRLLTNALMASNIAFYARLGYAEVERREEDGFSRVYMEKRL